MGGKGGGRVMEEGEVGDQLKWITIALELGNPPARRVARFRHQGPCLTSRQSDENHLHYASGCLDFGNRIAENYKMNRCGYVVMKGVSSSSSSSHVTPLYG